MKANNLTDYIYLCMRDQEWWTFWDLQTVIKEKTNGKFYGEPSISAAIRNIRKDRYRQRYKIDSSIDDPIERKRIVNGKGYKYRLIFKNKEKANE
tara:strand:+ start:313 stop:597 length:285 start_codon:yes stop_codon:yes gene_type:complete